MLTAVLAIGILAALFGLLLGYSAIRFKVEGDPIVEQIDGRRRLIRPRRTVLVAQEWPWEIRFQATRSSP